MKRKVESLESKVVVQKPEVVLRVPETGAEFAQWLEDRGWDYWDAEKALHVPWYVIRDACVYKSERLPYQLRRALMRLLAVTSRENGGKNGRSNGGD